MSTPPPRTGLLVRRAYVRAVECAQEAFPEPHASRDLALLGMLKDSGPLCQQELSALSHVNRSQMVKLVDALERRGWVRRRRDPVDRRRNAVCLTDAGGDALLELQPALQQADELLTEHLTADQRARLVKLLHAMVDDPEPIADSLSETAGYLIAQAHHRLRLQAVDAFEPLGIEPRHFGALTTIAHEQPCSQQHIARCLGVSAPAVIQFMDELADDGLVQRTRNPQDRRAYDVTLTAAGEGMLARAQEASQSMFGDLERRLGADGVRELESLLSVLLDVQWAVH